MTIKEFHRMKMCNIKPWWVRIPLTLLITIVIIFPMFLIASFVIGFIGWLAICQELLESMISNVREAWTYVPMIKSDY